MVFVRDIEKTDNHVSLGVFTVKDLSFRLFKIMLYKFSIKRDDHGCVNWLHFRAALYHSASPCLHLFGPRWLCIK
jgi:hypothetical protein